MEVRFWGVRGSVAASGAQVARIGGNTSCVEVTSQGERLILDAGTGIRALGEVLLGQGAPVRATLLFSHLHWDHVQGFPFFAPAYVPGARLTLRGPGVDGGARLRSALEAQMSPPNFPVTLGAMRAVLDFQDARPGEVLEVGPFRILPFALPHPQGCLGYRIESDGRTFVYATDVELTASELTPGVLEGMRDADAMALDAQYTPEEYLGTGCPSKRGWGHSTMVDAAQVARAAGVKRLFLFHHDPGHTDEMVEEMAEVARGHFAASEPAREGKRIVLSAALPFATEAL